MIQLPARRRLALISCIVLFLGITQRAAAQDTQVLDEIVAVVGEDIILRSEVTGLVLSITQQQEMEVTDALWMEALNQIIDDKVVSIHAKRDTTIIVTDDQLEQTLDERISQMAAQVGGETQVEEIYGKSIVEIKAELREDFRDQLMGEQFQGRKLREIKVTPSEIQKWFDQIPTDSLPTLPEIVRVSHIVRYPDVTEEARQEAMEVITTIRDKILAGENTFEEMADLFSEDPGSVANQNGGHYDLMPLSDLVPEFASVASRIEIGEVSQVFETEFGLHILRVNQRRGELVDYNHILIQFDESKSDPTEAIAFLSTLRDSMITYNVPFELLARRHSEEEFSARQGGRVTDPRTGERNLFLENLGATWRQTLDTLQVNEISNPAEVELLDGRMTYHIVRLSRRTPEHKVNIETDYELIQQYALRDKQNAVMRKWIDGLRKEVYIDIRVSPDDGPVASTSN